MYKFNYRNKVLELDLSMHRLLYKKNEVIFNNKAIHQKPIYYIKFSSECNLCCSYCFQNKDKQNKKIVDNDSISNIFDNILSKDEKDIVLFGGEPFLDINLPNLNFMFKKLNNGIRVSAFTNGCFSPEIINFIEKNRENLGNLVISLDGPERIHNKRRPMKGENSFHKIIENIHQLIKLNISIVISINLDRDNLDLIEELLDFLILEFGLHNLSVVLNRVRHSKLEIKELTLLKKYIEIHRKYNNPFIGLNSVIYKKLWYVLNNLGYMQSRCRLGISHVIDFEQAIVYTCPQKIDTYVGELTINGIINDKKKLVEYSKKVNKENDNCEKCKYINYCKYGCIMEGIPYDICKTETECELDFIFENFENFYELKEECMNLLNFYNEY